MSKALRTSKILISIAIFCGLLFSLIICATPGFIVEAATITGIVGSGTVYSCAGADKDETRSNINKFSFGKLYDVVLVGNIYYSKNDTVTAGFSGVSSNWRGYGDTNSEFANYGSVGNSGVGVQNGYGYSTQDASHRKSYHSQINGLTYRYSINESSITTINWRLDQYNTKVFWARSDILTFSAQVKRDATAPTLSSSVANNGYTRNSFKIGATDSASGVATLYTKMPGSSYFSAENIASKTISNPIQGWYEFYAVDNVGNQSAHYKIYFDKTAPTLSSSVANNGYTNEAFSITASDNASGISKIYTKTPNSGSFSASSSNTVNITNPKDGRYEFYAKDNVGNESAHYIINYDKTAPTGSIQSISGAVLGAFTNSAFKYIPSDSNQIESIEIKRPNAASWQSFTNTTISAIEGDGLYQFRCTDIAGNVSAVTSITLDTVAPGLTMENKDGVVVDSATINAMPYFYTDDDEFNTISFYRLEGSTYVHLPLWDGYKNRIIYYYERDLIGINTPYDQSKIYYDRAQAIQYIILQESTAAHFKSASNWTSAVAGTIIENEKPYAKVGANYWIYTAWENGKDVRYIFFDEARARAYISSSAGNYLKSSSRHLFYEEATIKVVARDRAGNETSRIFTLDMTAPTGSIQGVENGYANTNFTYTATDSQSKIAKVYYRFENGSWSHADANYVNISKGLNGVTDGRYEFYAVDTAGNESAHLTIILDATMPEFAINAFYKDNQRVSISIVDDNLDYVTIDGGITSSRSWNTADLTEGSHTIVAYDKAGNSTSRSFTVDKTAPSFTLNDYYRAGQTITSTINESNLDRCTLDGSPLSVVDKRITIVVNDGTSEGRHTIVAYDRAGNSTTVSFIVDKTAPKFTLNSFYRGGQTVQLSIAESNMDYVTLDGSRTATRSWNADNLSEMLHTIVVYDRAGNSTAQTFTVDRTAPKFTANSYYAANQNIVISDNCDTNFDYMTLNFGAAPVHSGGARNFNTNDLQDGTYSLTVYDRAGNSTTKTFTVDKVAPEFALSSYYRAGQKIQLSVIDANPDRVMFDGSPTALTQWNASDLVEGRHTIVVTDAAGNTAEGYFTVDKTAPSFTLNAYYAAAETININITELHLDRVEMDGHVQDAMSIIASSLEDGSHKVIAYDRAGNSTTVSFIVDKTAPLFDLKEFYAANETVDLILVEDNPDYVTLDGIQVASRSWNADSLSEGEHTIVVYDKAGNSTSKTFYFKTSKPVLALQKNSSAAASGVHIKAGDTIAVVINDSQFDHLTFDGKRFNIPDLEMLGENNWRKVWVSNELEQGTHTIVTFDKANNQSTVKFVVDTTLPSLVFRVNGEPKQSGIYLKATDNLSFSATDINLDRILLDGETTGVYQYSAAALSEIKHTVQVFDKAGNTVAFEFTIDRTAPEFFINEFYRDDQDVELSINEINLAFVSFDSEPTELRSWSTAVLDEGKHTIVVTDMSGNSTSKSFVVDKTAPSFTLNDYYRAGEVILLSVEESNLNYITLNGSVTTVTSWGATNLPNGSHTIVAYDKAGNSTSRSFIVDTISPYLAVMKNNVIEESPYFAAGDLIRVLVSDDNFKELKLNNKTTQDKDIKVANLDDGTYTLVATDNAGNSTTVSFIIDKTAPGITLRRNGTTVDSGAFFRAGQSISLVIAEPNKLMVELDDSVSELTSWRAEDLYEGNHTIVVTDRAGNTASVEFIVDITVPEFTLNSFYKTGLIIDVSASYDQNFEHAELKKGDSVIYSGAETKLETETLDEGNYILTVYDRAGNSTSKSFTVDKIAPKFTLNSFYRESDYIRFVIEEINLDYVTLDGVIESSNTLSGTNLSEGSHTVVAYDRAGNSTTVTFIMDKTAPMIELREYYKAGETVYFDVQDDYPGLVLLDGVEFNEGSVLTDELDEGSHTVTAKDIAGNTAQFVFTVDKVAPEFSLNPYYRESDTIFLSIRESNLDYVTMDNGVTDLRTWQCTQLDEGSHTIAAYDRAGNSTTVSFIVDKTAPDVTIFNNEDHSEDGAFYPADTMLRIDVSDANFSHMTLNYDSFEATTINIKDLEDGLYTLRIFDKAGNVTVSTFTVDKTAPEITLRRNMVSVPLAGVYFSGFDTISIVIVDKNQTSWFIDSSETILTSWKGSDLADGEHTIEVFDKAGNVTVVTFTVQKTLPNFELKDYYVKGDVIDISLYLSPETLDRVELDGGITYLNRWTVEELGDGKHTLAVFDKAGNTVSKTFVVDTTPPTLEVFRNSIAATDPIFIKAGDMLSIAVADDFLARVEFDGEPTDLRTWTADELDERLHTIVVYDHAGNAARNNFTVDKTAPAIQLKKFYIAGEVVPLAAEELNLSHTELNGTRIFVESDTTERLGEGKYLLTIFDLAGNRTDVEFFIDLTAPVITLSGISIDEQTVSIINGANSYGKTVAIATDIAKYQIFANKEGLETPLSSDSSLTLTEEGTWAVYAIDENGYESEAITFNLDATAPQIIVSADTDEATKFYTNSDINISIKDTFANELYVSFGDGEFKLVDGLEYHVAASVENEGTYSFYAVDLGGLRSETRLVTLDVGAPTISLDGITTLNELVAYTNATFTVTATDNHFESIFYKKTGGEWTQSFDAQLVIDNTKNNEAQWEIYAVDKFGQRSSTYTVTISITFDFQNISDMRNGYKTNTWYTISLPSKIYSATSKPDIAGTYSFENENDALSWAMDREKEYRVSVLPDGGYSYVSMSNESVFITYPTDSELNGALAYYARKYLSTRKIFNFNPAKNTYPNPMTALGSPEPGALTHNAIEMPDWLQADYSDLPIMLANKTYIPVAHPGLAPVEASLTYLGSMVGSAAAPHSFKLNYGESLYTAMTENGCFYEGYYLFEECDLAGNSQSAIIFIDLSAPTISAHIVRGDSTEDIAINQDVIGERSGVFYALSFEITELLDNIDGGYELVSILSDKYAGVFTAGDTLPILDAGLGAGKYTITVYDRSYNSMVFTVIIAGNAPSWYYTGLSASNAKLSIYLNKNDNNTAFISVRLIKIKSDGTYVDLQADSLGTPISPATTAYTLTEGGKYTCIIVDTYGRTTEMAPIFYERGLPTGTLSGVQNGGATRNSVTFSYADTYDLKVFISTPSGRVPELSVTPVYDSTNRTYTATFEPVDNTYQTFILVLFLKIDEGIFIEYTFSLDRELPTFTITGTDGQPISPNGDTNQPFRVDWGEDGITARYRREGYAAQNYSKSTLLTINTLYTFSLTDRVGNEATFTVYVDSEVHWHFSASSIAFEDNTLLSNSTGSIIVDEEYSEFTMTDAAGTAFQPGDELTVEGVYTFRIVDRYGNRIDGSIILDFTAPKLYLNDADGTLFKEDVTLTCDDSAARLELININGKVMETLSPKHIFRSEGSYIVLATDLAGNQTKISFVVDKHVDFTSTAVTGLYTTSAVTVSFSEIVTQAITLDGAEIEPLNRYTQAGSYAISLSDAAGNTASLSFTILSERMQQLHIKLSNDLTATSITLAGEQAANVPSTTIDLTGSGKYSITIYHSPTAKSFSFDIELDSTPPALQLVQKPGEVSFENLTKKDVTAMLYCDGKLVSDNFNLKDNVNEKGNYVLVITDSVGNSAQYEFEVKVALNAFSIVLICVGGVVLIVIVILIIKGRRFKAA